MRRLLFTLIAFAWLAQPAVAQVVTDGELPVTVGDSSSGPAITALAKTTAGTNRVGIYHCSVSDPTMITSVTWNAVPMAALKSCTNGSDGRGSLLYWIANPPTGASTVQLNSDINITGVCTASSYSGAHQSVQDGATNCADGTASPATVDCAPGTNELIVDNVYFTGAGTPPSVGANQTQVGNGDQGGWFGAASYQAAASGATMSWTLTSPTRWTSTCASLKPFVASTTTTSNLMTFGVGKK